MAILGQYLVVLLFVLSSSAQISSSSYEVLESSKSSLKLVSQFNISDYEVLQKPNESNSEGKPRNSSLDSSSSMLGDVIARSRHVLPQPCQFGYCMYPYNPYGWDWRLKSFLVLVGLVSLLMLLCAICFHRLFVNGRRRMKRPKLCEGGFPRIVTLSEIKAATKNFHPNSVIFDSHTVVVYQGYLHLHGTVAIKIFSRVELFAKEYEPCIQRIEHKHIIPIRAWCVDEGRFMLVYPYMPYTLGELLDDRNETIQSFHNWKTRISIIEAVASALVYLHEGLRTPIVHNNVKACTIFVDSDLNPMIGHLGYSFYQTTDMDANTFASSLPSVTDDVYNFGVVLFELAIGRGLHHSDDAKIIDEIWALWGSGKLLQADIDSRITGSYTSSEMEALLKVGLWCVHPVPNKRPSVSSALRMLLGKAEIPDPPAIKPKFQIQIEDQQGFVTIDLEKHGMRGF